MAGDRLYRRGGAAATVLKESAPSAGSLRSALVHAWESVRSSVFVVHIRSARWGALTDANTQPFHRPWGRRDWLLAHSGSLEHRMTQPRRFEPVGSTDSEELFCELLARIAENEWRSIGDCDLGTLASWFRSLNENGSLTTVLTMGAISWSMPIGGARAPSHLDVLPRAGRPRSATRIWSWTSCAAG